MGKGKHQKGKTSEWINIRMDKHEGYKWEGVNIRKGKHGKGYTWVRVNKLKGKHGKGHTWERVNKGKG